MIGVLLMIFRWFVLSVFFEEVILVIVLVVRLVIVFLVVF